MNLTLLVNKKNMTFEDYLEEQFMEENPTVLDDDLPDATSDWIGNLEQDELLVYADAYANIRYGEGYTAGQVTGIDMANSVFSAVTNAKSQ